MRHLVPPLLLLTRTAPLLTSFLRPSRSLPFRPLHSRYPPPKTLSAAANAQRVGPGRGGAARGRAGRTLLPTHHRSLIASVICSTDESVPDMVRAITGGRLAHAAVESVAGDLTGAVLSSVRPGGTVLLFGGASGATFSASIGDFIFRGVTLKGFWVGPCLKALSHEQRQVVVREAFDLIANGTVTPFTGDKMDLSEFAAALKNQMVENRQGKILLSG
ncbi:unnamed protein product [Closterium sp. Naga37s-1]|nr:unnamed protein product [Closterium sp. Naga37s-1]